jgi:hypothetical protein
MATYFIRLILNFLNICLIIVFTCDCYSLILNFVQFWFFSYRILGSLFKFLVYLLHMSFHISFTHDLAFCFYIFCVASIEDYVVILS